MAERRGRAVEDGGLAEHDGVSGHAIFGARRGGQGRDRNGCGERAAQHQIHGIPPALRRRFAALRKMRGRE